MKSKPYSLEYMCPKTGERFSRPSHIHSGVCPYCGHMSGGTIPYVIFYSHFERVSGQWVVPTLWEYLFQGKRKYFRTVTGKRLWGAVGS